MAATAERILELAKQAEFLHKTQVPTEQRHLLDQLRSNCSSIAELFVLLTISHSICSFVATKQENGGVDGTRTRGLRRDRPAF